MAGSSRDDEPGARFRRDPHPVLRPFVVEYWGMSRDLAARGGFTITPDSFGELICCADPLDSVAGDERVRLPACFLVGLLAGPLRIEAAGVVRFLSARVRAWSVGRLLAAGPDRGARGWMDATGLFGSRLAPLAAMVARRDWESGCEVLDRVLIERSRRWKVVEAADDVDVVGPFLDGPRRTTGEVAGDQQTSTRQVERRVRSLTGTSPRQLACLARFHRVRDAIWTDPAVDLARLAFEAGYSDQPHMTREFRRYSGLTPSRFAREALGEKKRLAAADVAFVQERAEGGG